MNEATHLIPDNWSAHPLFPPEQAFLWLPGFDGEEEPYCTYNEFRAHPAAFDIRRFNHLPTQDEDGVSYIPPYPVSPETYISWHTNVNPPYPYHPIPLLRPLVADELIALGRAVLKLTGKNKADCPDPVRILTNAHKSAILSGLTDLGLLDSGSKPISGRETSGGKICNLIREEHAPAADSGPFQEIIQPGTIASGFTSNRKNVSHSTISTGMK